MKTEAKRMYRLPSSDYGEEAYIDLYSITGISRGGLEDRDGKEVTIRFGCGSWRSVFCKNSDDAKAFMTEILMELNKIR